MVYILLVIILFGITAYSGLRNGRIDFSKSLSVHIGRSPRSIIVARICFTAITILMYVWYFGIYLPVHYVPPAASLGIIIFGVTILLQGIFPYNQRPSWSRIHNTAAWTAAFIGPLLLLRFASVTGGVLHIFLLTCGILSLLPLIAFAITPKVRRYFLPLQLSIILMSLISFLALSAS